MATRQSAERIDIRLSRTHKTQLKRAADLAGQPISQFLVSAALSHAQQVIEEHTQTRHTAEAAARFVALIEEDKPNAALVRAAKRYRARHG